MQKALNKKIKLILIFCVLYIIPATLTYILTRRGLHLFLIWNLLLACIPLMAVIFINEFINKSKIVTTFSLLIWLLFFPNAPYFVTDFIHIREIGLRPLIDYPIAEWLALLNIAIGFILSIVVGMLSLFSLHKLIIKYKGKVLGCLFIGVVSFISGYAIYVGRFLRFNSWDMLKPISLVNNLIKDVSSFSIAFSILMGLFISFIYCVFYVLFNNDEVLPKK